MVKRILLCGKTKRLIVSAKGKSGFGAAERITSVPDQKGAAALDVQCRCGGAGRCMSKLFLQVLAAVTAP
ncbi:hypothetical protein, partial [Sutterella wadsworthensis]|uniref:hypothetical protein n=1 Tax=Sutterella wadsworthensis TaxID=40545 RepID=UPI002666247C